MGDRKSGKGSKAGMKCWKGLFAMNLQIVAGIGGRGFTSSTILINCHK